MTQTWTNRPICIKKNVLLAVVPWDYALVVIWINNEVSVGVYEINPEGSGSPPDMVQLSRSVSQITRFNPDSHPKQVDSSGSATTFVFVWKVSVFLNCQPSLLIWSCDTNLTQQTNHHEEKCSFGITALQGVVPWDYHIALQGVVPWNYTLVVPMSSPIPNELEKQ